MTSHLTAAAICAALCASQAVAQDEPVLRRGQGWSALGGQTVGRGSNVISGRIGWPGLEGTYLRGLSDRLDVGARFSLLYGYENVMRFVIPGIKLQGVARLNLIETTRLSMAVSVAPGIAMYFRTNNVTEFGVTFPLTAEFSVPIGSAILLNAGMAVPMYIRFGTDAGVRFPLQFGLGAEYFLDRSFNVSFSTRMGPSIDTRQNITDFGIELLVGVGYRL